MPKFAAPKELNGEPRLPVPMARSVPTEIIVVNILMILTSHDQLGDTGQKTGFWLEEFAAPYYVFKDAGVDITIASPKGGQPPLDPKSDAPDAQTEATKRFRNDSEAGAALATTHKITDLKIADFDAVFYPGGHGPLWDLANDAHSIVIIQDAIAAGKPVGLVCHAPGVLKNVDAPDGNAMVKGRKVSGFTNGEEAAVGLKGVVPFLVEDMLIASGALYSKGPDFEPYAVEDGMLITGQNPASSELVAKLVLSKINKE
jgi:putative intracellular protease/amidase